VREISRERERERIRERIRESVFLTLSVVYPMKLVCTKKLLLHKKKSTLLYTLNTRPFLPLKMAAEITTKRRREKKKKTKEENKREEEEQRPRITRDLNWWFWFFLSLLFEKDVRRGTENGEATDSPSGEGAEKEGKVGERTEEEERRCGVVIGRRRLSCNGARVANASGSLGCRLRHARLLPRGVSIANVVV